MDDDYEDFDEEYEEEQPRKTKRTGFCGVLEDIKNRPTRRIF